MLEVSESAFERDVIEASRSKPVLVDFWAPWCGPCRALGPVLERLEAEMEGRFALVKVNSDENPELAAAYRVRSIPFVVAFVDGQAVDSFLGAQPAGVVRQFVERLLPDPSDQERRKAAALAGEGLVDDAIVALRAALALRPANEAARLDLVELLAAGEAADAARLDEARQVLDGADRAAREAARWRALDVRVRSRQQAASLPSVAALADTIAREPNDLAARIALAEQRIAAGEFAPALEQLIEVVARDRKFGDDIGRRMMLSVFDLAVDQPGVVSEYRRRLAATLNR